MDINERKRACLNTNMFSDSFLNSHIIQLKNTKIIFYINDLAWVVENRDVLSTEQVLRILPDKISKEIIKNINLFV